MPCGYWILSPGVCHSATPANVIRSNSLRPVPAAVKGWFHVCWPRNCHCPEPPPIIIIWPSCGTNQDFPCPERKEAPPAMQSSSAVAVRATVMLACVVGIPGVGNVRGVLVGRCQEVSELPLARLSDPGIGIDPGGRQRGPPVCAEPFDSRAIGGRRDGTQPAGRANPRRNRRQPIRPWVIRRSRHPACPWPRWNSATSRSGCKELGATYYLLESWGSDQQLFRFYCKVAVARKRRLYALVRGHPCRPATGHAAGFAAGRGLGGNEHECRRQEMSNAIGIFSPSGGPCQSPCSVLRLTSMKPLLPSLGFQLGSVAMRYRHPCAAGVRRAEILEAAAGLSAGGAGEIPTTGWCRTPSKTSRRGWKRCFFFRGSHKQAEN